MTTATAAKAAQPAEHAANSEVKYFDLHTTGMGYLGRIREVKLRKGAPFWACTIAALHGEAGTAEKPKPEYTYFDCNVVGSEAQKLVKRCILAVQANKKVLVGFVIGDIYLDKFTYDKGEKKGQTGYSLKGRLLRLRWIKVDGKLEYQEPKKETAQKAGPDADTDSEASPPAPAAPTPEAAQFSADFDESAEEESAAMRGEEECEAECF